MSGKSFPGGPEKRTRAVPDTIHGHIRLPAWAWVVIDTHVFQRLRGLRQTGLLSRIYPGATHDRFSHSLGTAYLALTLMESLARTQPELHITDGEVHTVVLAALCHDLGHGPCSHAFEHFMHVVDPAWSHEQQSARMLMHLVDTSPGVGDKLAGEAHIDIHMAAEMILGSRDAGAPGWRWHGPPAGREFLFEVVSNASTGVDVDKWDYLTRDSKYLAIPTSFVFQELLTGARVIQLHKTRRLAWPGTFAPGQIMNMFMARYSLHGTAYQRRVVRIVDRMTMEALLLMRDTAAIPACPRVPLGDVAQHADAFTLLTDWLVDGALQGALAGIPDAARQLFGRVACRELWDTAGEAHMPPSAVVNEEDLARELSAASGIAVGAFVVDVASIHCGRRHKNPMKPVPFYRWHVNDEGLRTPVHLDGPVAADYSRPLHFQRRIVCVFVKSHRDLRPLGAAFASWAAAVGATLARDADAAPV